MSDAIPPGCAGETASASGRVIDFRQNVEPFIQRHCLDCHSGREPEGDFSIVNLGYDLSVSRAAAGQWKKMSQKMILGEMPPEDEPRPMQNQLSAVIERIHAEVQHAAKVLQKRGGNEVVLRRLNKRQFNYTVYDLFGLEGDFASRFPADATEYGFNNIGSGLVFSASQLQSYMAIADVILDKAIVTGERPKTNMTSFTLTDLNARQRRLLRQKHGGDEVIVMRYGYPQFHGKNAPIDGKYRLRVTAYAVRNNGKHLRLEIQHGTFRNRSVVPPLDGQLEVVDGQPKTFEFVASLKKREVFALFPPDLTNWMREEDIAEFDGPGIAIKNVEVEGPLYESWPPKSHRVVFGDSVKDDYSGDEVAEILERFAAIAFRRPAPQSEVSAYLNLYRQARSGGDDCLPALKHTLKAILCSPYFLYLYEEPGKLDDFALASRLSYFLWCSMPDDELLGLAKRNQLSQQHILKQQIGRMTTDSRIERFVNDFVGQWLNVDQVGEMQPDTRLYPEYDTYLERSMREETQRFFREILVNNLSIDNFIDSDFAMLNERLAEHYGISDVDGGKIRRVRLPADSHRGGLLTHASILTVTSNGTTTSPVVRGVWMLENILGQPSLPPPPISTDIEPDIRGVSTIKEQLAKHRTIAQCNVCHRKIDPYGLALENFDVVGGWREHYRKVKPGAKPSSGKRFDLYVQGPKVESYADAPNFGHFDGFDSFRRLLMKNKHLVVRCVAEKMMVYALGRGLDISDDNTIDSMAAKLKQHGHGLHTLVENIILSREFRTN
ncbi:MAG: DUF1592 domain-containing protein [Fuerstiella sp.]|nr:DUF1592 domain-containing protein [Fuerstiella sp.]